MDRGDHQGRHDGPQGLTPCLGAGRAPGVGRACAGRALGRHRSGPTYFSVVSRRRRSAEGTTRPSLPPGYLVIWTTVAVDLVGFGIVAPILPLYAERFHASGTTVGLLFASFSLAQFLCAPILGRLSDRIGRKPVILLSLFGTAAGSIVTGVAGAVWVLFLGRIIDGASGASVSVAQGAVTDLASPEQRPRLLGMLGAAFGVGFVIGPALGGLGSLIGPRVPFFVAGGIAFVNGLVAIVRLPETRPSTRRLTARPEVLPAPDSAVAAERRRRLRALAVVGFLSIAAFAGFESTFSLLGKRRFGLTIGSASVVFLGIGLFMVVVQGGLVGRVTGALGAVRALRGGLLLTACGLALLAAATRWIVLVPALALLALGQGIASPTLTSLVANRAHDERRGEALGFQQAAGSLARIAGPAAAGLLFDHAGIPWPYLVGAALSALALALVFGPAGGHEPIGGVAHGAHGQPVARMHPTESAAAAE